MRWIPAIVIMLVIFLSSSTPSSKIQNFGEWDSLVKKGSHMLGYGMLSVAIWYGFNFEPQKSGWAWLLALIYAMSDEFHQRFTPGRHSSIVDVLLYDGGGAGLGLCVQFIWFRFVKKLFSKKTAE